MIVHAQWLCDSKLKADLTKPCSPGTKVSTEAIAVPQVFGSIRRQADPFGGTVTCANSAICPALASFQAVTDNESLHWFDTWIVQGLGPVGPEEHPAANATQSSKRFTESP